MILIQIWSQLIKSIMNSEYRNEVDDKKIILLGDLELILIGPC